MGEAARGLEMELCRAGGVLVQRHASKEKQRRSRSSSPPSFQGKAMKWLILGFTEVIKSVVIVHCSTGVYQKHSSTKEADTGLLIE